MVPARVERAIEIYRANPLKPMYQIMREAGYSHYTARNTSNLTERTEFQRFKQQEIAKRRLKDAFNQGLEAMEYIPKLNRWWPDSRTRLKYWELLLKYYYAR